MNKCKTVNKRGVAKIVIKSLKGQQINERELYAINHDEVKGLLHVSVLKRGESFKLVYDIGGFMTFNQFLLNPINKAHFARILQDVLVVLKSMQDAYFNRKYLMLNFDMVMVRPDTKEIYFVYVPIQGFETEVSLKDFLLNIIQAASFVQHEDNSYVRDYITILNSGINFSEFELEEYIKKLRGVEPVSSQRFKYCPRCKTKLPEKLEKCTVCGMLLSGMQIDKKDLTYSVFDWNSVDSVQPPPKRQIYDPEQPQPMQKQVEDYEGTAILGSNELVSNRVSAFLIRQKNKERISIGKSSFRLGKDANACDYSIGDNSAVSRKHADIIIRDGRAYIIDLNSTNHTYVDGRQVQPGYETEIRSGSRIRLANEDFVFDFS